MTSLGPGAHTRVRRLPEKAAYDADTIHQIFDDAPFCTVAATVDGLAMALPTLHVREGTTLFVHANKSNALLQAALAAGRASVSATVYEGIRLARSGFESSIAYRSAVVVGDTRVIDDLDERRRILDATVEAIVPGRSHEIRPASDREVALTLVVAIDITEGSAKISAGPTDDADEDRAAPVWSGTIPARLVYGEPVPATDGAMASGAIDVPASVRRLLGQA